MKNDSKQPGSVKFYNARERWGFIQSETGQDHWVGYRDLDMPGFRALEGREEVDFDSVVDAKGRSKALHVRRIGPRRRGIVRSFDMGRGFGFLQDSDESQGEIFVHHSSLRKEAGR